MLIQCPTGFSFRARPWELGDQAELLTGLDDSNRVLAISMLKLAALPKGVENPGPYSFKVGGDINWDEVANPDITVASFLIRIVGNPLVHLPLACQKCGSLQDDPGVEVDLREIETFQPSDEGLQSIQTGMPVPIELPVKGGGMATVHLVVVRGSHLKLMVRAIKQDQKRVFEIQNCMGIEKIELPGQEKPIVGLAAVRRFYAEQDPWTFGQVIEDKLDELFGGADATVTFRCCRIGCTTEQEAPIPLDPHFYGLSRRKKRKGGLKLSAASPSTGTIMPEVYSTSSSEDTEPLT